RQPESRPGAMVMVVAVRNDRVQAIVAAGHLENDENVRVASGGGLSHAVAGLGVERGKCVRQKGGNGPRERAAENGCAEKFAAGFEGDFLVHKKSTTDKH